jgi:hypothetical protein
MSAKSNSLIVAAISLLLFSNIAIADYVCVMKPIEFDPVIADGYEEGERIRIDVYATELPLNSVIIGRVDGYSYRGTGLTDMLSKATIDFGADIPAGEYEIYFETEIDGIVRYSDNYPLVVKEPLVVSITPREVPPLYTSDDIVLILDVKNSVGQAVNYGVTWSAYIGKESNPISIEPLLMSSAGTRAEYRIPKEQFYRGTLYLTATINSPSYWPTEKQVIIRIEDALLSVDMDAPVSSEVGRTETINVYVTDQSGQPIEAQNLKMEVTLPGTVIREQYDKSSFIGSNGVYTFAYTFEYGQGHRFSVSAWADGYGSDIDDATVAVSGGGTIGCSTDLDCSQGFECKAGECVPEPSFPWIWVVGIAIVAVFGFLILRKRLK